VAGGTSSGGDDDVVVTSDEAGVRLVTLNRPARLNAFTAASYVAVARAFEQAAADEAVAVVVLTGAGRAFSAGVDLGAWRTGDTAALRAGFDAMLHQVDLFPKPVIAAVNGLAVGIGMTLLLHCDLVMADDSARFRAPFVELGTTPEAGSSWLLPRAIGAQNAMWTLLSGEWMDAAAAVGTGLAWRRCPAGTVLAEATAVARQLAVLPQAPIAAAKRLVRDGWRDRVVEAIDRESEAGRSLHP
jgi:enoyl-CoA hydratase/carnithine racemase